MIIEHNLISRLKNSILCPVCGDFIFAIKRWCWMHYTKYRIIRISFCGALCLDLHDRGLMKAYYRKEEDDEGED